MYESAYDWSSDGNFGHSKLCVYYDQIEDKLHAFAQYNHIW
jgi:hypothetical protein